MNSECLDRLGEAQKQRRTENLTEQLSEAIRIWNRGYLQDQEEVQIKTKSGTWVRIYNDGDNLTAETM